MHRKTDIIIDVYVHHIVELYVLEIRILNAAVLAVQGQVQRLPVSGLLKEPLEEAVLVPDIF